MGAVRARERALGSLLDVTSSPSCLRRDLLPFTLRLPQAVLEASSFTDLKTISNLGLGKSSLRVRGGAVWSKWGPRTAPS